MLPKIEKVTLKDKKLMPAARLEIKLLRMQKVTINGFRFLIRGDRCVALGPNTKNDFDLISTVAEIQEHSRQMTGKAPDRFRFAFTG